MQSIKDIEAEDKPAKLPQLVIIIDELADLMMIAKNEDNQSYYYTFY